MQEPAVDPNYAAQVNLRYHEKIKAIDEAIEQRDRCFSQLGVDEFLGHCAVAAHRRHEARSVMSVGVRKETTMAGPFQRGLGNWTQYRSMLNLCKSDEIDLHFGRRDAASMSYSEAMDGITGVVETGLYDARQKGRPYVMFIHGSSTSRQGQTTARSQVRKFMRSKAATPLIERKHCIQHATVFVAKLRPSR